MTEEEGNENGNPAERLMEALISKMEQMDGTIQNLQAENTVIKQHMTNPEGMLKKMGFISIKTPMAEGIAPDIFRGGSDDILKGQDGDVPMPHSNEDFHAMGWEDIHVLADSAKDAGHIGNVSALE